MTGSAAAPAQLSRRRNYVFRWVVPVAVLGFVIAWFLRQISDTMRGG